MQHTNCVQKCLNSRQKVTADNSLGEQQIRFRAGRSASDTILKLRQIIEKNREFDKEDHIDFVKASDNVNKMKLWIMLDRRGCPMDSIRAIPSLYEETRIQLVRSGKKTYLPDDYDIIFFYFTVNIFTTLLVANRY